MASAVLMARVLIPWKEANGTVLASGGSFGSSETTNVCPNASTISEVTHTISSGRQPAEAEYGPEFAEDIAIFPNPTELDN